MTGEPAEIRATLERAVRSICPSWLSAQVDDIVHEAWLRVVKARGTEEYGAPRASYLWKAAHSAVIDAIRARRRLREEPEDGTERLVSVRPDPECTEASSELRRAIDAGLARLSADRRAAVLLFLYGYSLKESAAMLGWRVKRVDNQRYQGLAELRRHLQEQGLEP